MSRGHHCSYCPLFLSQMISGKVKLVDFKVLFPPYENDPCAWDPLHNKGKASLTTDNCPLSHVSEEFRSLPLKHFYLV